MKTHAFRNASAIALMIGMTVAQHAHAQEAQAAPQTSPVQQEQDSRRDVVVVTAQKREETVQDIAIAVTAVALATAVTGNLLVSAGATLITSGASALAKASLDASLQDDLPEESRASAFGRSESMLQLAWVLGGALGVLVYTELWVGFTAITSMLIPGLAQTVVSYRGASLIPGFGGNRPVVAQPEELAVAHR